FLRHIDHYRLNSLLLSLSFQFLIFSRIDKTKHKISSRSILILDQQVLKVATGFFKLRRKIPGEICSDGHYFIKILKNINRCLAERIPSIRCKIEPGIPFFRKQIDHYQNTSDKNDPGKNHIFFHGPIAHLILPVSSPKGNL